MMLETPPYNYDVLFGNELINCTPSSHPRKSLFFGSHEVVFAETFVAFHLKLLDDDFQTWTVHKCNAKFSGQGLDDIDTLS